LATNPMTSSRSSHISVVDSPSSLSSTSANYPSSMVTSTPSTSASVSPIGPTIVPSTGVYNYAGCYTEGSNVRAFSQLYANDTNTISWCAQKCVAYNYFGAEYGRECWCGNSFGSGSVITKDSDCSMLCSGDSTAYCGAGNRLSVYVKNGTAVQPLSSTSSMVWSSSSASQSSSSTPLPGSSSLSTVMVASSIPPPLTSSSSTPTQTGPVIKQTIGAYTYQGCYTEATHMRALSSASYYNYTGMTLELCFTGCAGSTYWGVEYGGECYCGTLLNSGSTIAPDTDCSFVCPGSKFEYCGAGNRLSLYSKSAVGWGSSSSSQIVPSFSSRGSSSQSLSGAQSSSSSGISPSTISQSISIYSSEQSTTTAKLMATSLSLLTSSSSAQLATATPVISQGNVNFTYYSCMSEPSSGRLLSTQIENNGSFMTIERCLQNCYSYAYSAVEYGRECWCGNTLNLNPNNMGTPAMNVTDRDCNFKCPGNTTEYCGAGNRLSLYWFDVQKAMRNNGTNGV